MSNKIEIYKTEEDAITAAITEISNQLPDVSWEEIVKNSYRYNGRYAAKSCNCACGETHCIEYNMEHDGKYLIGRAGVCESCGE